MDAGLLEYCLVWTGYITTNVCIHLDLPLWSLRDGRTIQCHVQLQTSSFSGWEETTQFSINIILSQTKNCTQQINKLESKLYLLFKLMKSQTEV